MSVTTHSSLPVPVAAAPPTTVEEKLEAARALKRDGNNFFKERNWRSAISKYHRSKLYCKGFVDKLDFIPGLESASGRAKPSDEQQKEATELMVTLTNNLAACLIQTEKWDRVITLTNEVLQIDSDNSKALYRRGVAKLHLGCLDEAEEDLLAAQQKNPKDKGILEHLQQLQKLKKVQTEKEKVMYQAMFNS